MHNLFRVNKKCHKRVCPDLRFVVRADEKLTAFLELESAIRAALSVASVAISRTAQHFAIDA